MLQEFLARVIFLKFVVCDGISVLCEDVFQPANRMYPDPHPRFADRADGVSARVALKRSVSKLMKLSSH
jgi:hypothetical protein